LPPPARPHVPPATVELIARLLARYPCGLVCSTCGKLVSTLAGPRDGWRCAECRSAEAPAPVAPPPPAYVCPRDPPGPAERVKVLGGVVRGRRILDRLAASETTSPDSLTPLLPAVELRVSEVWVGKCHGCRRQVAARERPAIGWRCARCGGGHALVTRPQEPSERPGDGLRAAGKRLRGVRGRPGLGAARRSVLARRTAGRPVQS
jgi:hypothetical protein